MTDQPLFIFNQQAAMLHLSPAGRHQAHHRSTHTAPAVTAGDTAGHAGAARAVPSAHQHQGCFRGTGG
jgi:hypothetical protein